MNTVFPGVIVEIEYTLPKKPVRVLISVDVHGKNFFVKSDASNIDFEIFEFMPVFVEVIKHEHRFVIKKAEPVSLSERDLEILKTL